MKEIKKRLYAHLDDKEQVELEKLFRADLYEPGDEAGITQVEFDAGISWLEANMGKHELEADDIAAVKHYFAEYLAD